MKGRLWSVPDYKCRICTGEIGPLEGLPAESVVISNESLVIMNKFCYIGDISVAGGTEENIMTRIRLVRRNVGNFCLYLPRRSLHCALKVTNVCCSLWCVLFSMGCVVLYGMCCFLWCVLFSMVCVVFYGECCSLWCVLFFMVSIVLYGVCCSLWCVLFSMASVVLYGSET